MPEVVKGCIYYIKVKLNKSQIYKSELKIATGHIQEFADVLHLWVMPLDLVIADDPMEG